MRAILTRLTALSGLAVALCCAWFATMELLLRHDGYVWRALIAAAIVAEGLTTTLTERLFEPAPFRWPLTAGPVATAALGAWVLADDLVRPAFPAEHHFEGYLVIIGLMLVAHGALTVVSIVVSSRGAARS